MSTFRESVVFGDGDVLSIQASEMHYCSPRQTDAPEYRAVEVGNVHHIKLPSRWEAYADGVDGDDFVIYSWVPVVLVHELIKSKGGIVSGECPPLALDTYNNTPVS